MGKKDAVLIRLPINNLRQNKGVNRIKLPRIPTGVTFLVDTREQRSLLKNTDKLPIKKKKLNAGDYSIEIKGKDYSNEIVIERKRPCEFLSCIGTQRDFFEKQLQRLRNVKRPYLLICGCTQEDLRDPFRYGSLVSPESVWGSLISLEVKWKMRVHFELTEYLSKVWLVKTLLYYYHALRKGSLE